MNEMNNLSLFNSGYVIKLNIIVVLIETFNFCFREERNEFIRAKYMDKRFVMRTCASEQDLLCDLEHAVNNQDLNHLLQVFGENVDLSSPLPSSVTTLLFFSFYRT